jgi:tetratricopeptide (TPR) repeat protein
MTANAFDWDDELPPETEEEVYGALLRALRRKQGFGLFFVQCSPAQGEKIVADLCRDLPQQKIQELHLTGEVVTLYDQINHLWQQQPFDVLVVEGLQASLYAYEDTKRFSGWSSEEIYHYSWKGVPQLLNHLNQQREHLRNDFPARLVFLVPPFVVDYFIQRAADFLDWRSGLFRFPRDPKEIAQDAERFIAEEDYAEYLTLTPQTRIKKILHLKSLQDMCPDAESKTKLLLTLGLLFAAGQDYGNAITSWEKALAIKPDLHAAWYNRGVALSDLERKEEAIASYDQAIAIKPDLHEAWNSRGVVLFALGRNEAAVASYDRAVAIKPDDDAAWNNRGGALSDLGRKEEAIASYDQAVAINPDKHEAWNNRGVSLSDLGRNEAAITSYDQAVAINPDDDAAWYNRGNALYKLERKEEAIASYDQAIAIKPDKHEAWHNRGGALYALGRNEEAIASYDQAVAIKPDLYEAWFYRGNALYKLERKEAAITSYDKALEIKPDDHEAWNNRGYGLYILGRKEEAIASYDQALELAPDNPGIFYNKACSYALLGNVELALENLQRTLNLDAEKYREWAKTDADFAGVRADPRFQALIGESMPQLGGVES